MKHFLLGSDRRSFLLRTCSTLAMAHSLPRTAWAKSPATPSADSFGVASGDPSPQSVVIWTRLPEALLKLSSEPVEVQWWMKLKDSDQPPKSGHAWATAGTDFTVTMEVGDLDPGSRYLYGFAVEGLWISEIGEARTLPSENAHLDQLTFAYVSCQYYGIGYFTVYEALAQDQEVDFCVHLGDSIYETVGPLDRFVQVRPEPEGEAKSLEEYRSLYKKNLTDPHYREARRKFTWIHLPDDHEIYDNYAGTDPRQVERRTLALRAYFEYIPMGPQRFPRLHRTYTFGNLATFFALDERQYRDGESTELSDPTRTMLGRAQRDWLLAALENSGTAWNIILSQVMMMNNQLINRPRELEVSPFEEMLSHSPLQPRLNGGGGLPIHNPDSWDGFPAEKKIITSALSEMAKGNTLVCTGDIHNMYAGYLTGRGGTNAGSKNIAFEVTTGSVTSPGIGDVFRFGLARGLEALVMRANAHLRALNFRNHMYVKCVLRQEESIFSNVCPHTIRELSSNAKTAERFRIRRQSLDYDKLKVV